MTAMCSFINMLRQYRSRNAKFLRFLFNACASAFLCTGVLFTNMDYAQLNVGWSWLSIPKLQQLHVEVWKWTNNFIPYFIVATITYPYWDWSYSILAKKGRGIYTLSFYSLLMTNTMRLEPNGWRYAEDILATFSWEKYFVFLLQLHNGLFSLVYHQLFIIFW